jgi:GT2 family glycosyltransferase
LDIVGSLSWGKKTTMIEGCGLIIKKKVFESLGGFDSSFFMYSEDLDLCWRAWLCGYKIKLINTASINHFGGGTSLPTTASVEKHVVPLFRRYETEKNTIRMMLKNATIAHLTIAIPLMFFLIVGESILYICTGQFTAARNLYMAIGWNFTHISETIVERRMVQAKKVKPSIWPLLAKKITKFEVLKLIGVPKIKI